jgi:hypothetical protein
MGLNTEASAALVFLILYAILFAFLCLGYVTGRLRLRSRYTVILFHVLVRLASQTTGLAFGIIGFSAPHLLVAYFILYVFVCKSSYRRLTRFDRGAEGYFTLVLCTYRFLISWQNHNTLQHDSWLEPRHPPGMSLSKRFLASLSFSKPYQPMSIMHYWLIGANAIIVAGGSLLAGGRQYFEQNFSKARAMRVAGQSIFLAINVFLLYCIYDSIIQFRRERGGAVHRTLLLLLAVWPLLFVRGLYGILSSVVPIFNYFSPSNYGAHGLTVGFVVSEYILSTTMEWSSCALLMLTYITSLDDPKKGDLKQWDDVGKGKSEGDARRTEGLIA